MLHRTLTFFLTSVFYLYLCLHQALILQPNLLSQFLISHRDEKFSMCRVELQEQPRCQWALGAGREAAQGSKLQSFESTLLRACLSSTKQQQVNCKTHGNGPQRLSKVQSLRTQGHTFPLDCNPVFPSCSSSYMASQNGLNALVAVFTSHYSVYI